MPDSRLLFDLTARTALVTGSTQGLGLTIARGLAQAGATVVLNGRNAGKLALAVDQLRAEGLSAHGAVFDVTRSDQIASGLAQLPAAVQAFDIVVNNAGVQRRAPLEKMEETQWREVIDANLTSAFLVTRQIAPAMIARRSGKIINICSLMSELGRPTTGNYAAAKGGLKMLTRAMATEWSRHNIQVNGIGPGYFLTEMTKPLADDPVFSQWICQRTPAGRWGDPSELVGAAIFLASNAANFVSGQIIYVDGGLLAAI
ncbi:MAG TPA: SDR family NAD(P)-dependent oxidoreductase [Opitutaceae bacterium]|jgi:gluconate 5-dehydrogenase|nr:SDR family NAD(P)-dependent oxidoreductase [Opitutaceae bacterium]